MAAKFAILSLGLWLAGAQGFEAQACCAERAASPPACDGCGDPPRDDRSSRPDCCSALEAQQDLESGFPRNDMPGPVIAAEFLTADQSFAPWRPETAELVARRIASRAQGPPLHLRYEVFLI